MDFSAALKNSNRLNPGCGTSSSLTKTFTTDSNSKPFYPRSKTESTQSTDTALIRVTVNIGDCRSPDSACLNGGVCIPEYALPGNSQNRQWASSPSRHVCRCPSGFEGTRCESSKLCTWRQTSGLECFINTLLLSFQRLSASDILATPTSMILTLVVSQLVESWSAPVLDHVRKALPLL